MRDTGRARFVGRGGDKLDFALTHFDLQVAEMVAADVGSHIGGFVDCLLQRGVQKVYAIDTSYGTLAWRVRQDPRVVVMERRNALHVELPEKVDLVTADLGWTRQEHVLGCGPRLVKDDGVVVSLLKPQYEALPDELHRGVVKNDCIENVVQRTLTQLAETGIVVDRWVESPLKGGKGNREFFLLVRAGGSGG